MCSMIISTTRTCKNCTLTICNNAQELCIGISEGQLYIGDYIKCRFTARSVIAVFKIAIQ